MVEVLSIGWAILALGAFVVGISKTALPGSVTLSVALFAAVLPARESTGVLLMLLLVGDMLAIWAYRRDADWKMLRRLAPPVIVGLVLGGAFLALANDLWMRRSIGAILLILTALTLWMRRRGTLSEERAVASPLVRGVYGALGGFTSTAANAGGPVMSLYFLAAGFNVRKFIATQAWFFVVINLVKLPIPLSLGLVRLEHFPLLATLAPMVVLGALVGRAIVTRINRELFHRIVIALTVLSALNLLR